MRRPRRSLDALLVIIALVLVSGVGLAAPLMRIGAAASPAPSALVPSATPAVTPAPSASPIVGTTYHLAPDGDDQNAGTAAKPWETLAHAATKLKPGDTLEVADGTYTRQSIDWQTSGSADGPITDPGGGRARTRSSTAVASATSR